MNWRLTEKLRERLAREKGAVVFPPGARTGFVLAFPNEYELGMSNLGFHIMYREINARPDMACERAFLPSSADRTEHARTNTPLLTIETQRPLYEFGLIGFAVSFEPDYFHILDMLKLGQVEVARCNRTNEAPIVIAGGPCATFNPEPLSAVIDLFVIGEGEETVNDMLDAYQAARHSRLTRAETIQTMAQVEGVYAPAFPRPVRRRWVKNIDRFRGDGVIETQDTEFGTMKLVEVARGCGRHCRFCMAGFCFRPPRVRSVDSVMAAAEEAVADGRKLGLVGAAVSDFPQMDGLCEQLEQLNAQISVASLRADSTTDSLLRRLKAAGHKTITLAPEAGSDRLRRVINKGLDEKSLLRTISMAVAAGIHNVKLYFMIGLPFESDSDMAEIVYLSERVLLTMAKRGSLSLSVNPFVPKPFTPFQWMPMADTETLTRRIRLLTEGVKGRRRIRLSVEDIKDANFQAVLARGDYRIAEALLAAHENGGRRQWRATLNRMEIDAADYTTRLRSKDEEFPWDFIDMGVTREYLWQEYEKASQEAGTPVCFPGCTRCGVCTEEERDRS